MAKANNFVEACSYLVRKLVRTAYTMPENSVRPARQEAPTGVDGEEYATVKIILPPSADFGTSTVEYKDDPASGSTKVIEDVQNVYRFTASVQFFRHAEPKVDEAGVSPWGLSAVDKAARLPVVLSSEAMLALTEQMGLGLEDCSDPRDVGALVHSATWEDRGSIDLTFAIVNREQFFVESIGSLSSATLQVQEPGKADLTIETIEVATS